MQMIRRFIFTFFQEMEKSQFGKVLDVEEGDFKENLEHLLRRWKLLERHSALLRTEKRSKLRHVRFFSEVQTVDHLLAALNASILMIRQGESFPDNIVYNFTGMVQSSLDDYLVTVKDRWIEAEEVPRLVVSSITSFMEEFSKSKNFEYYYRINLRLFHELGRYTSAMEDLARMKK